MFTAYFDASGNRDSKVLVMAGFVSRIAKWKRLENEWAELLPPGIPAFHMTDFASSRKGWESWKGPEHSQSRIELIAALVDCIKRNTNKGFGVSLRMSDYKEIDRRYELTESGGGPYPLVGLACLAELRKWAERRSRKLDHSKVLCIFERGDAGLATLIDRAWRDGFNAVQQSKQDIRAFDSCDLAAWKTKSLVDDGLIKKLQRQDPVAAKQIMDSFRQMDSILQLNAVLDATLLEKMCKETGVPLRQATDSTR